MKKLMFAAVACAAGLAFGEVSSQVVGYAGTSNKAAHAPIITGQFFDVSGSPNFMLKDLTIPGSKEWVEIDPEDDPGYYEWVCEYVTPKTEFIRVLDTSSLADIGQYTYVSAEYLLDALGDVSEEDWESTITQYKWAIGWWKYSSTFDYKTNIKNKTAACAEWQLEGTNVFPNGTAFIGNFGKGKTHRLVSSGAVADKTFAFSNAAAHAPVFGSQIPVDIDLTDMAIPGTKEWVEIDPEDDPGYYEWVCEYVTPKTEFIRVLDTSSLADIGQYTYVSAEYLLDALGDVSEEDWESTITQHKWAIGWWKYSSTFDYKNNIKNKTALCNDMVITNGAVKVSAGTGFIGNFGKGKTHLINFPSALDVPSKK